MGDNQGSASAPPEAHVENSEWEYEYDETETESFYVTVDISSASQQTRVPKKMAPPSYANPDPQNGPDPPEPNTPIDLALQGASTPGPSDPSNPQDDCLQILDLHTPNPLISYNGRIYSCTWASTIGTDIFLAAPDLLPAAPNDPFRVVPLHTLPNVSIIGTSCINLTARPATLKPRNEAPKPQPHPTENLPTQQISTTNIIDPQIPPGPTTTAASRIENTHSNHPLKIPLSPTAANTRRAQTSFLDSLIAIKAAKGETDQVTVYNRKTNQGTGWRVQRRLAAEEARARDRDDDNDDDDDVEPMDLTPHDPNPRRVTGLTVAEHDSEHGSSTSSRPVVKRGRLVGPRGGRAARGRRGRGRVMRRAGGLFRDYVPEAGDQVGADIRARGGGGGTPVRWGDVEGESVCGTREGETGGG
ncbi:MAG: hypothetical protein Q9182_006338 [Xanthomendoza sp. 2 TL-2023]